MIKLKNIPPLEIVCNTASWATVDIHWQ